MQPTVERPLGVNEIELGRVIGGLKRYAPAIVLTTLLAGAGTYLYSRSRPPVYEAVASLIAVDNDAQNSLINNTLVTAPPLPQGAVEEALKSKHVLDDVIARLRVTALPPALLGKIQSDLQKGFDDYDTGRFRVRARLDTQQRGVYEIRAQAETPDAARELAQAGVQSLIAWDNERAKQGVERSRASLQQQLRDVNSRVEAAPPNSIDRQTLITSRAQLLQNLSQVSVLETAASGTLSVVVEAGTPRHPVSPRPLRDAALAALLALFLSGAAALLFDGLRRRVEGAEALLPLGLPLMGQLPLLRASQIRNGFLHASHSGQLHESIGFLRLNLLSLLQDQPGKRVVISSSHPGEGKSSISAALAQSLGASGLRVLIVDADMRRPSQMKVWNLAQLEPHPLPGGQVVSTPAHTVPAAALNPEATYVLSVAENVDLLPAGNANRNSASVVNQPSFIAALDHWSRGYDVVLIDSPPLLSVSDTLAIARHANGILFVVESGKTRLADVERTLLNANVAGVRILGFALNKLPRSGSSYYYNYGYYLRPEADAPPRGLPRS